MTNNRFDMLPELEFWYEGAIGRYIFRNTRDALYDLHDMSFGHHIVQLGVTRTHSLFERSPINHRIYVTDRPGVGSGLVASADELPLASDSIDILIAHHSLEFSANPHQVLREIQRVLTPHGHLLVVGFNPYSVLGLNSWLKGMYPKSLWHRHKPISERRLTDWLRLLGCEVQARRRLCSAPPGGRSKLSQWLIRFDAQLSRRNLPIGSLYVLHAIKQVSALHQSQRQLHLRRGQLTGLVMPKPAVAPRTTTGQERDSANETC